MNILVTGAGGALAHTIVKALNHSSLDFRLFTAGSLTWAAELYVGERGILVPHPDNDGYIPAVMEICRKFGIEAILVGSDDGIMKLSQHSGEIERETGARTIVSDPDTLMIGYDKWNTAEFLRHNGIQFPSTVLGEDEKGIRDLVKAVNFPLVVRPRPSFGSKGLAVVRDEEELRFALRSPEGLIVQEYLPGDDEEYSVGVVVSRRGDMLGSIAMKRVLRHGVTIAAIVDKQPEVQAYAEEIAGKMRPYGECNIQLRLTPRGPVCFEINPRFSSTDGQRAVYGFNAVEAVIRNYILEEDDIDLTGYRRGFFARYWDELYVPVEDYEELCENGEVASAGSAVVPEIFTRRKDEPDDDEDGGMTSFPYHLQGS